MGEALNLCLAETIQQAKKSLKGFWPCVVKANGLAEGKGVLVPTTYEGAVAAIETLDRQKKFPIMLQAKIIGREVSYFAFVGPDGESFLISPPVRDFKRRRKCDDSPNTGGMGAIYWPNDITKRHSERAREIF